MACDSVDFSGAGRRSFAAILTRLSSDPSRHATGVIEIDRAAREGGCFFDSEGEINDTLYLIPSRRLLPLESQESTFRRSQKLMTDSAPIPDNPTPDDAAEQSSQPEPPPRPVSSKELLQGREELLIEHDGEIYRLRLTPKGRLYLTK
jgi:hemin uptake protein HemP